MKKFAIIVAGGIGSRMQHAVPKQFLLLKGKPVLYYTIDAFLKAYDDCSIILVLPEDHVAAGQEIIDAFFDYSRIQITIGGRTRFHSVQNGLKLVNEDSIVFVHDAVRCMISKELIQRCYEAVLQLGSAVPVVASKDSVRIITDNGNEALPRDMVKLVQTPQTFYSKILLPAFNIDYKDKFTDEATVVEAFGLKVNLVEGEEHNFKITVPLDLELAEKIIDGRSV
jgi:2-C-methyl-D-erythritol 4-phosphate cytidylyltransferase